MDIDRLLAVSSDDIESICSCNYVESLYVNMQVELYLTSVSIWPNSFKYRGCLADTVYIVLFDAISSRFFVFILMNFSL